MAPTNLLRFAWLEVTGRCNEQCVTCYADSSPQGTHGSMTEGNWTAVMDQLADMGTKDVQFIGGEPTLYPHLPKLIEYAYGHGLGIEVFSNLTHVRKNLWDTFRRFEVKLATSYYSDTAEDHDRITKLHGSHKRTRANIRRAVDLGLTIRGGIVSVNEGQRVSEAAADLTAIGVDHVGGDRVRAFGRGSQGAAPRISDLCGHCALGQCAIGPDGDVWPCVLGRFLVLGNVQKSPLAEIWESRRTSETRAEITAAHGLKPAQRCTPPQFLPSCGPCGPCVPSVGVCDPKEAESPASGVATIGAPD